MATSSRKEHIMELQSLKDSKKNLEYVYRVKATIAEVQKHEKYVTGRLSKNIITLKVFSCLPRSLLKSGGGNGPYIREK